MNRFPNPYPRGRTARFCRAAFFLVWALLWGAVPAFAAEISPKGHGIAVTVPDGFTVLDERSASTQKPLLEALGMDAEKFAKNLKSSGTLVFAVTPDGKNQINLKVLENSLSKQLYDLTELTPENQEDAGRRLIAELSDTENMAVLSSRRREISGTRFFQVDVRVSSAGGEFCFTQYFTIFDGKYYALVYYNSAPDFSERDAAQAEAAFSSLKITRRPKPTAAGVGIVLQIIFITLVVLLAVGAAVYILYTFARDVRRARQEREAALDHISRRRF